VYAVLEARVVGLGKERPSGFLGETANELYVVATAVRIKGELEDLRDEVLVAVA
jgi:hypothetical protein